MRGSDFCGGGCSMWQKIELQSIEFQARTPGCAALYADLQKLIRHVVHLRSKMVRDPRVISDDTNDMSQTSGPSNRKHLK